ncbi:MAG: ABC transporter substrate-binding protein [Actinomycetota bacterium]
MFADSRHPSWVAAVVAAALIAAACGGGDAAEPSAESASPSNAVTETASTEESSTADAVLLEPTTIPPEINEDELTQADDVVAVPDDAELEEAAFPRTVEHAFGSTEVPARPERIVALAGVADMDALLALGVVPYAAASYYPVTPTERTFAPWNQEYVGEIETFISAFGGLSLEALAALEPDLIVGQSGDVGDSYEQYAGIAPTVLHAYPTDWREPIRIFGEALGLEERAVEAIAEIEAEIAAIAERVPDPAPAIAMVAPFGAEVTIYNENLGAGPALALSEIGVEIVGPDGPLSMERLGELDAAEWIIVFDFTLADVEGFVESTLFQRLPAAQAGNVVVLSPEQSFSWVLETSRSLPATLDGILTQIGL